MCNSFWVKMEKPNSSTLARTKSDQLVETVTAAFKSPISTAETVGSAESGGTLSRKSSRMMMAASPGRTSSASKNTHIRKSRSAQMKLDLDDVSSGAALSRASSASLGFSFSFTGFAVPNDEIADSKPFSDEDIRKLISYTMHKTKLTKNQILVYNTSWLSFSFLNIFFMESLFIFEFWNFFAWEDLRIIINNLIQQQMYKV